MTDDHLLDEQVAYYRARAAEYDQWFLRQGRYDRGARHRETWFAEVETIRSTLGAEIRGADVLELACGTGLWTEQLVRENNRVLAVDSSPEALAINQNRVGGDRARYERADIFSWTPPRLFDVVFFAFWLSHVPPSRFEDFWTTVRAALKPGGRAFVVDSLLEPSSTATDHPSIDNSSVVRRKLNDGREFDIVKVFYEPEQLAERLAGMGWSGWARSSGKFFLYGSFSPNCGDRASSF
jgi:demethylmenaquinone methyltransferase/2-methoxy-6-polyprenyl-1,4-benzoquinol methylase